jgi:hypothetical protein
MAMRDLVPWTRGGSGRRMTPIVAQAKVILFVCKIILAEFLHVLLMLLDPKGSKKSN